MLSIREIVSHALIAGYLTIDAENRLRNLLQSCCEPEDLTSFIALQLAAMDGIVKQESRERGYSPYIR